MEGDTAGKVLRLLHLTEIDESDELEQVWMMDFREFEELLVEAGGSDDKVQAALQERASSDKGHVRIVNGLLFGILCDRSRFNDFFRYLTLVVRDGYAYCCKQLYDKLINHKFTKMADRGAVQASPQQTQLLELTRKLVSLNVQGAEKVCHALLRQIQGGNVQQTNRWLARVMLAILTDHKPWLLEQKGLIPVVFYTFCRIAADHGDLKLEKMRKQEAALCCELWRERPLECRSLGRDAVRVLQDVSKIPEFEALWADMLATPQAFGINELWDLLGAKTPKEVLASRLTPEMESQLLFIMSHVKMGQQQRYQKWFMARWGLNTPEGETLIPDLIRYICCCYHPPNEVIRSEVVQRWAAVGWLLTSAKNPTNIANIKLAIFYDWLFFVRRDKENREGDSVMNVEPAALLITRSIPKWLDITCDLMEFLFAVADEWCKPYRDLCRRGIYNAACECVKVGVIQGWDRVSACPQIAPALRARVRAQFRGLCKADPEQPSEEDVALFSFDPNAKPPVPRPFTSIPSPKPRDAERGGAEAAGGGDGGDSEEDSEVMLLSSDGDTDGNEEADDGGAQAQAQLLAALGQSRGRAESVAAVLREMLGRGRAGQKQPLCEDWFLKMVGEEVKSMWASPEGDEEGGSKPPPPQAAPLLTAINSVGSEEDALEQAADLCAHLQAANGAFAASLLASTACGGAAPGGLRLYRAGLEAEASRETARAASGSSATGPGGVEGLLVRDLRWIFGEDCAVLFRALPCVTREMPDEAVGNAQVLLLVCGGVGPQDEADLCVVLQLGEMELLCTHDSLAKGDEAAADKLLATVSRSLQWESFEQHTLWHLFCAELGGLAHALEHALPKLLPLAEGGGNPEVLAGLVRALGGVPPTQRLVAAIAGVVGLHRDVGACAMSRWAACHDKALGDAVGAALNERGEAAKVIELLSTWGGGEARRGALEALVACDGVREALDGLKGGLEFPSEGVLYEALEAAKHAGGEHDSSMEGSPDKGKGKGKGKAEDGKGGAGAKRAPERTGSVRQANKRAKLADE